MDNPLSIGETLRRHARQKVEFTESLLETACSCACAGVPISEIYVQTWVEWDEYKSTLCGRVGFGSQVPVVKYRSEVYRLC